MKLMNDTCPQCGASLEMNMEKLMAYCPYCRAKFLLDVDADNYISETEATKREEEATKREEINLEKERQKQEYELKKNKQNDKFIILIIVGFAVFAFIWLKIVSGI